MRLALTILDKKVVMIRNHWALRTALAMAMVMAAGRPHPLSAAAAPAQGQAAESASPALSSDLDELVREALEKNPAVQGAQHQARAQRLRVPQVKAFPDPTLSVGWMGSITPFSVQEGDPSSYRALSAMQEVPYPGKLRLRGEVADRDAQAARWDYEDVRRRVAADVKTAYYDYFFYDKALQVASRYKDLLEKLSAIAEARYRVGKGIQQDVLRSQVEVSILLQKTTTLEQQRATALARLNTLLARDPETPVSLPAELRPAGLQSLDSLDVLARANDTGLGRERQMLARNHAAANLARKDYYPDLAVGYMYEQRPSMPDMHGLTFSVKIPVFYKDRQRNAVAEAQEQILGSERALEARANDLYFELKQQYLAAKASDQLLRLFSQAVVPQSSLALESSLSAYQVGSVDFLTVLGNYRNLLDYETEYYRELADYQAALARMEILVGQELTSEPGQPPAPAPAKP